MARPHDGEEGNRETQAAGPKRGSCQKRFALDWQEWCRATVEAAYAQLIAENVVEIALGEGSAAIAAAIEVADRIEGRVTQSIQVSDIVADLQSRSDEELTFHLVNGRWPTAEELLLLKQPVEPTEM